MSEPAHNASGNLLRVITEMVAFRYSNEQDLMLVGEAEIVIVLTGNHSEPGVNLHSVRIDVLSLFDPSGQDVYTRYIEDATLKATIERIALEHYLCPPRVPIGLPGRTEW
ncbi:MAG: hypothetical protein JNM22_06515 [Saprospiraceae bacterium]|nr:hypothetical protein [Saprospiraceae bacterium]